MNRVKGYTLVDVLFGMVFIITVVSMTTMGYSFMMRSSRTFSETKSVVLNAGNKNQLLYTDIWKADSLVISSNGFNVYRDSLLIRYEIDKNLIRRQHVRVDTLPHKINDFRFEEDKVIIDLELLGETYILTVRNKTDSAKAVNQNMKQLGN